MKRISRMMGVTLLEIMLVLAIAAMVIVLSIRYYQSASLNQKVNTAVNTITAIIAAQESFMNGSGSYSSDINALINYGLPQSILKSPWGGDVSVAASAGPPPQFTITIPNTPDSACAVMSGLLASNAKVSILPAGCASAGITVKSY